MRGVRSYSDFTLPDVVAALRPGRPETLLEHAEAFKLASEAVRNVHTRLPAKIRRMTTDDSGSWTGPAAAAFVEYGSRVAGGVPLRAGLLDAYAAALTRAAHALTEAKAQLATHLAHVDTRREKAGAARTGREEAAIDADARAIIERLAAVYAEAGARVKGLDQVGAAVDATDQCRMDAPAPEHDDPPTVARRRGDHVDVGLGNPTAAAVGVVADPPSRRRPGFALGPSASVGLQPNHGIVDIGLGHPLPAAAGLDVESEPGTAPTQRTATGRVPGLGAVDYTLPPNVPVTVRTRPGALLVSELVAGGTARPKSGVDPGERCESDRPASGDHAARFVDQAAPLDGAIGRPASARGRAEG
jgi:uncharacterized protein YukE